MQLIFCCPMYFSIVIITIVLLLPCCQHVELLSLVEVVQHLFDVAQDDLLGLLVVLPEEGVVLYVDDHLLLLHHAVPIVPEPITH